ncbi:MAG TPA: hypothetical protein VIL20_19540, partial [Sandaracinaceae bacterium]
MDLGGSARYTRRCVNHAPFALAVCNPGSEALLVRELAGRAAPAYRRRGLVTFKLREGDPCELAPVFARVWGRSLGLAKDAGEVLARLGDFEGARLHVYARDGRDEGSRARAEAVEAELRARARFASDPTAEPGDPVIDVVVAGDEPLVLGARRQRDPGWRTPGGRIPIEIPPEAPSRAYAKIEEALAWSGLALRAGERAIE